MSFTIHCEPYQKDLPVEEGVTVLEAIRFLIPPVDTPCAGHGRCGKCVIELLEGTLSPVTESEKAHLSAQMLEAGYRLACQARIVSDVSIRLSEAGPGSSEKKSMIELPRDFRPAPKLRKYHIARQGKGKRAVPVTLESIRHTVGIETLEFSADALCAIQPALDKGGNDGITLVVDGNTVLTAEAGDTSDRCYGIAFDIGTTTIVAVLCDIRAGKIISSEAADNTQSTYGADVVSRIEYCRRIPDGIESMKKLAVSDMNRLIDALIKSSGIERGSVYSVTVAGNTAMCHFLLGVNPVGLSKAPFVPLFCEGVYLTAEKLSLDINRSAAVYVLPGIAGFIGADISAVAAAVDIFALDGVTVVADIGTNGEMLAARDGSVYACSAAAGPAFEGACIRNGMRAAEGAIRGMRFTDNVYLDVIGNTEPAGICGSGLIDITAELLRNDLVSKAGALISRADAVERGIPEKLSSRLFCEDGENGFLLYAGNDGHRVAVYQKDIREIQLAKAAISSGIKTLLKKLDTDAESIDRIILSGAFGSFINTESAMAIGLIPKTAAEKIVSIGNGAGIGAVMVLLSSASRKKIEQEAGLIKHVDLSQNSDFYNTFTGELLFGSVKDNRTINSTGE